MFFENFELYKRGISYLEPLIFLVAAICALPPVLFESLFVDKCNRKNIAQRVFATVFTWLSPMIAEAENDTLVPQIVFKAAGVILELGAGIGNQIPRFDPSKVAKIYGVEPVTALHNQLRSSIKKAKLDDVYTVVPCGIENTTELQKYGIEPKSIDTIISISVLCSVPQPEEVAHQLYSLLKPGGKLVFYEHVRSPDFFSRQLQRFYNIFWPYAMGNCHLDRETEKYLLDAGEWVEVDMWRLDVDDAWKIFPRIAGHLTK